LWNLLHRRENYIDRLVDLILDRLERDDADLSDPRANLSGHMDAAAAFLLKDDLRDKPVVELFG